MAENGLLETMDAAIGENPQAVPAAPWELWQAVLFIETRPLRR